MADLMIKSTGFVLDILDDLFKGKVTVSGIENIPLQNPILFTANHFTRAETLFLPYYVHKHTGKMARSLADKAMFKGGALTDYLNKTGTLSTDNPDRDNIMINDLLTGENNWIIYPEGNMMKNKKITFEGGRFYLHLKDKVRSLFTGAATIALKSQLLRDGNDKAVKLPTAVVPINISYYPIRPGHNKMKYWVEKLAKKISPRMAEELEIEGNILAEANMHIHFCKPIYIDQFISTSKFIADRVPFVPKEKKDDLIVNYYRHRLTTAFMRSVYNHVAINLDHIFALTLYFYDKDEIHIKELISRIYLNIKALQKLDNFHMHASVKMNVFKVLAGKEYEPLKSIFELARSEGIIVGGDDYEYLQINRSAFDNEYEFHNIRLKNVMKILINEMMLLDEVKDTVKKNAEKSNDDISQEIFDILIRRDQENYEKDYEKFRGEMSANPEFGKPFFLKGRSNKVGIVLSHGYKASPEEVRQLAEYLNSMGHSVYCVRLHGHGTSPENLKHSSWLKWYDSYMRGVVALDQICDNVVFAGFSTGGLLSLYTAAQHPSICRGVITINAALKLQDIRVRLVKVVNFWNELSDKFRGQAIKDYIDDTPENPEINYSRNYIKGVNELGKLMKRTKSVLSGIHMPTLVIQSKDDPIVKPESGKMIFSEIHAKNKELVEPNLKNHVIVRGDVIDEVFVPIERFLNSLSH